jgi:hypothetical protein
MCYWACWIAVRKSPERQFLRACPKHKMRTVALGLPRQFGPQIRGLAVIGSAASSFPVVGKI